jgi:hypothetical protein
MLLLTRFIVGFIPLLRERDIPMLFEFSYFYARTLDPFLRFSPFLSISLLRQRYFKDFSPFISVSGNRHVAVLRQHTFALTCNVRTYMKRTPVRRQYGVAGIRRY